MATGSVLRRVHGSILEGVDAVLVSVEVDAGRGLPSFQIIGQGDRVVGESRDRIRSAFRHSGIEFPPGRVTVNLAPTDLPKAGSALDLPIAVAIAASRIPLPAEPLAHTLFLGELGLDGSLRAVRGTLALLAAAEPGGLDRAVVPEANLAEASVCPTVPALGAPSLGRVVEHLRGGEALSELDPDWEGWLGKALPDPDLADVRGQESAKRALEIAAAGGHNSLLIGPPGSGKTLLARRLPGLLPDLSFPEALEVTRIHSVAGALQGRPLLMRPPFRAPHHTSSEVGLIGGGRPLRPGEISLAHRGVLFLDELPEFRRPVLEALRQPLEEGEIRIVRARGAARFPARFRLVCALNPCPCGYRGDPARECLCDEGQLRRYRARLSGPLLDRIDLHVHTPPVPWRDIADDSARPETSATVRARVEAASARQARRYAGTLYRSNAELPDRGVRQHCQLDSEGWRLLERAFAALGMSMRAWVRVLRVARTIADLAGEERIATGHLAEAIGYRSLDRH